MSSAVNDKPAVTWSLPFDGPTRSVFIAIIALILVGGAFFPQFFSPYYLAQQMQNGAFLGIVAAGAMVVILLGQIDLSVPWTMTAAATISTAVVGANPQAGISELGLLAGLGVGALVGFVNGFGVAFLRIPSMIWTLATNNILLGLLVYFSGFYALASQPSPVMSALGQGKVLGLPAVVLVWIAVSVLTIFLLKRTVFGRNVYLVGTSEPAAYLSAINTRRVTILAFVFAGVMSALGGMMLAGYAGQSYQRMGDPYLLPGIAAVVLGGTSLFGGTGRYAGTVAGVLLITLMSSMLSIMQAPEAAKQIAYGLVIIVMVGLYSRRAAKTG
ncbi:ABC transporter permease [Mameliella sediminis]|uniref:ABC transporter permease n=1 Tax=Mameliella sediminis TaxID=2836866 RepID=UPI001C444E93|nr:ABC transporter permease [Mameliella sediminis]MBV7395379.1 ABC transporter permease [Mameliella sediminis]MBY6114082.1 ABC transporter permease [Antarctobacter heliothermus]MBY6142570.1 ABC transporter permease [Mameliella alba]MCA0953705.1 ABC transporter permease [Mameliella alba]